MGIWNNLMNGLSGFRQAWLNADVLRDGGGSGDFDAFIQWEPRKLRYDLFWSLYQNNSLWDLAHRWSPQLKTAFALYKHTRHVFNPAYRLGEFWASHLMGGSLDLDGGDGGTAQTALPIDAANGRVRAPIAKLWRDSRWQVNKGVWCRYGAILGDAALSIVDDPDRGQVSLRVIHPGHLKWIERDDSGEVRSYIIEQLRYDPRAPKTRDLNPLIDPRSLRRIVRYNEEAFIEGGKVTYRTYLNGAAFNWRGQSADGRELPDTWTVPYPFIPLVVNPHIAIGLDFGMSEVHSLISKVFEVDDVASNIGDHVRRSLNAPWLFSGVSAPTRGQGPPATSAPAATGGDPQPGRDSVKSLYAGEGASATPLVAPLDVAAIGAHVQAINASIERDYPELQIDLLTATDASSGRAIRQARQKTEVKVMERRAGYDDALCRAQALALAIGGARGYPGYEGLGLADLAAGRLDHRIGERPVFRVDPLDTIEEDMSFWEAAGFATKAGLPLSEYLRRNGWSAGDLAAVQAAQAAEADAQVEALKRQQDAFGATASEEDVIPEDGP